MTVDPPIPPGRYTRLSLIRRAGVAATAVGAAGLVSGCDTGTEQESGAARLSNDTEAVELPFAPPERRLECQLLGFFTPHEALTVEAISMRFVPGTPEDPGAREACVVGFIDQKLASFQSFATPTYFRGPFAESGSDSRGPQEHVPDTGKIVVAEKDLPRYGFQSELTPQQTYRNGVLALDDASHELWKKRFIGLSADQQDTLLEALEAFGPLPDDPAKMQAQLAEQQSAAGRAVDAAFTAPTPYGFFSNVLEDTYEGMFADPAYGGNRGYVGWLLVGYPGAQRAYTPAELTSGPRHRKVQGLHELMPMHPGNPATHVVLPIAGTKETERP